MPEKEPVPQMNKEKLSQEVEAALDELRGEGIIGSHIYSSPDTPHKAELEADVEEAFNDILAQGRPEAVKLSDGVQETFYALGEKREFTPYERPRGEAIERKVFDSLVDTIFKASTDRFNVLIDQWIVSHPTEVQQRFYRTTGLSNSEREDLAREPDVKALLRNDPEYRSLASLYSSLRESEGRPTVRSARLSLAFLDSKQRPIEDALKDHPFDAIALADQKHYLGMQEGLFRSLYKKEIPVDREKALQEALQDPRLEKAFQDSLDRVRKEGVFQREQAYYRNQLEPWEIAVFTKEGYIIEDKYSWLGQARGIKILDKVTRQEMNKDRILEVFKEKEKRRLAGISVQDHLANQRLTALREVLLDEKALEKLTADLERETLAEWTVKREFLKRKVQDPEKKAMYERRFKEQGEPMVRLLAEVLSGGEYADFYRDFSGENEEELKTFFRYVRQDEALFEQLPSDTRKQFLNELNKGRKLSYFDWLLSVMNVLTRLSQIASP